MTIHDPAQTATMAAQAASGAGPATSSSAKRKARGLSTPGAANAPGGCPAEAIGRQIERAEDEHCRRSGRTGLASNSGARWDELIVDQLADRLDVLGRQLEWVKASSLAGVLAQFNQLRRVLDGGGQDAGETTRRAARLQALISVALRDLGGLGEYELGGINVGYQPDDFAEVLGRHVGIDVRPDCERRSPFRADLDD